MNVGDIKKNYKIASKIGEGGFGDVYLVDDLSHLGEQYAMKIVRKVILNDEMKIGLTLSLKCQFLIKYKEISLEQGETIVVMEYCNGGDLSKRIEQKKTPSDSEIYRFLFETTTALKALHDEDIIHRDIKPSNFFLISNGGFKLGDYGMARAIETVLSKTQTLVGSQGYTCPEILRGRKYTNKADIFSLGVTLIEFLVGHNPFSEPNGSVDMFLAITGTPVSAIHTHPLASHPAMLLALRMIRENPDQRPTTDEILGAPTLSVSALYPLTLTVSRPQAQVQTQTPTGVSTSVGRGSSDNEKKGEKGEEGEVERERDVLRAENAMLREECERLRTQSQRQQTGTSPVQLQEKVQAKTQAQTPIHTQVHTHTRRDVAYTFLPCISENCTMTETATGMHFFFAHSWQTVFIDRSFAEGRWQWTVQCEKCNFFMFGVVPSSDIGLVDYPTLNRGSGKCYYYTFNKLSIISDFVDTKEELLPDNAVVVLEADLSARTLTLFVNKIKVSRVISNIPVPLHFGISGGGPSSSFTSLSLRRI